MAVLLARQTAQLSLPESKEDNAARGAATVLKTDVYPCTLMQVIEKRQDFRPSKFKKCLLSVEEEC